EAHNPCSWSFPRNCAAHGRSFAALYSLENVQAARAVDQVDQAAVVEVYVISLHRPCARRNVRHERGDLARRMRVGDIDDAKAMREPGNWDLGAADLLAELMH